MKYGDWGSVMDAKQVYFAFQYWVPRGLFWEESETRSELTRNRVHLITNVCHEHKKGSVQVEKTFVCCFIPFRLYLVLLSFLLPILPGKVTSIPSSHDDFIVRIFGWKKKKKNLRVKTLVCSTKMQLLFQKSNMVKYHSARMDSTD